MIDNKDGILWGSLADNSYGGCLREELIIVRESDLTEDERFALDEAANYGDDDAVLAILKTVDARKTWDSCVCPSHPKWEGTE